MATKIARIWNAGWSRHRTSGELPAGNAGTIK
jgi:hypothetical protein